MTSNENLAALQERMARQDAELAALRGEVTRLRDRNLPRVDRSSRRRDRRQTVLGLSAVVLTLGLSTIGTASALDGAGTVFSDDIADANVKNADLANGAVNNAKLSGNAVGSAKVIDKSLTGNDLADYLIGPNHLSDQSVDSRVIKNYSITTQDIAMNAIMSPHLSADSVTSNKIADGTVAAADLNENAAYDKMTWAQGPEEWTAPGDWKTTSATCPSGSHIVSGGFRFTDHANEQDYLRVWNSFADFANNRWTVTIFHADDGSTSTGQSPASFVATAYCAR